MDAYEQLDPEGGFANLSTLAETQLTGKRKEKRALDALTDVVTEMKLAFGQFWGEFAPLKKCGRSARSVDMVLGP